MLITKLLGIVLVLLLVGCASHKIDVVTTYDEANNTIVETCKASGYSFWVDMELAEVEACGGRSSKEGITTDTQLMEMLLKVIVNNPTL